MIKNIFFGCLIAFLIVGLCWIFANILFYVRFLFFIQKLKRYYKKYPITTMLYGTMRISEDNVYSGGKTRLLTDLQLAAMENYKPGGIWYDEEKMPRPVTNYYAAPLHFVSFRYHTEGLSDIYDENKEAFSSQEIIEKLEKDGI